MVMTNDFTKPEYRDLTFDERRLLEWLIANGNAEASVYASQLPQVKVVARCTCGCPTLDLALGGKKFRTIGASTILADAFGHSPEGVPVNVILHAREGEISELEVISCDETKVFGMPTPEMLKVV
jgi:hypothetical protein